MDGLASILIVDDNPKFLKDALPMYGYDVAVATDGLEALKILTAKKRKFDLILLDVMMPNMNGWDTLKTIRTSEKTKTLPVIMITAVSEEQKIVSGLKIGADDYIVKPFEVAELIARVEVVLRRYKKTEDTFELNGLYVDASSMVAKRDGKEISLTPKEFDLLLLFLRTPNTALYRENIYEKVWGGELEYGSKTVDLHVQRLRKKAGLENELKSVSKVGYRLDT